MGMEENYKHTDMKKWYLLVIVLAALIGCKKSEPVLDQVDKIVGDYSYKISGIAVVDSDSVRLTDEIGAMEIVRIDSSNVLMTFNALTGPAYYTHAQVAGDQITLASYNRTIGVLARDYAIVGSGAGEIYETTILLDLSYAMQQEDSLHSLTAKDLTVLCKKN